MQKKIEPEVLHGEHPGWMRYFFELQGVRWQLLTIGKTPRNQEIQPHSSLFVNRERTKTDPRWVPRHSIRIDGILTVEAAGGIIRALHLTYQNGYEAGSNAKLAEVRRVLGV